MLPTTDDQDKSLARYMALLFTVTCVGWGLFFFTFGYVVGRLG